MPTNEHVRMQRGDRYVPAELLNAHSRAIEVSHDASAEGVILSPDQVLSIPPWVR